MRKIIAIIAAIVVVFVLSGCGSSSEAPQSTVGSYSNEDFSATITPNTIEVYLTGDGAKALYWTGTWEDQPVFISVGDREALDASLMGSGSETKEFKISDNKLIFDFGALGMTKTVELPKK